MDKFIGLECFVDCLYDYDKEPILYKRDLKTCIINLDKIVFIISTGKCQIFSEGYCVEKEADIYELCFSGGRSLYITADEYNKFIRGRYNNGSRQEN